MSRDFDQSDARELAEFTGHEVLFDLPEEDFITVNDPTVDSEHGQPFKPWSNCSEQWQIQSLLDAVREKGLEEEFGRELGKEVLDWCDDNNVCDVSFETHTELVSAPPEAICSAILSMEVE